MKRFLLIALALVAIQAFAQPNQGQDKRRKMHNLTPEQAATLQTKRLTLHLDLNNKQQAEIKEILLANAQTRKAKMEAMKARKEKGELQKPTAKQRYEMANAKLDHQIAMKAKMKTILNDEQFAKWEKIQARMAHRFEQKKHQSKKKRHQKKTE
jgi:hypothetical protein